MRPGRKAVRILGAATLAAVSLTVVLAATRPKLKVIAPPAQACVGDLIKVGAKAKGSARYKVKVRVLAPDGSLALKAKKRVAKKWRTWSVTVDKAGTYRTMYRSKPKKWSFFTKVSHCGGGQTPGSVVIDDDDAGAAMFAMPNMAPGASEERCIMVSYTGTLPATVRLYGTTPGTGPGLAPYLELTVTRGTGGSFGTCAGFTPDPVDHVGAGPGVIFDGTLDGWPDTYGTGLVDPSAAPEQWTTGESHTYRFEVGLSPALADEAQGLTAGQTFVWEARD